MERISFKTLCDLIANIDYIFRDTFPVSFTVQYNSGERKEFECGICELDPEDWAAEAMTFADDIQYFFESEKGIVELEDPDVMGYEEICDMLKERYNIDSSCRIFLNKKLSFDGEKTFVRTDTLSLELMEKLKNKHKLQKRLQKRISQAIKDQQEFLAWASVNGVYTSK